MDATLQEQFNRVQSALQTLVDSIAAYNPSTQAAGELLAADNALSRGLDQRMTSPFAVISYSSCYICG